MAGGAQARLVVCAVAMEDPGKTLWEIGVAEVHTAPFTNPRLG